MYATMEIIHNMVTKNVIITKNIWNNDKVGTMQIERPKKIYAHINVVISGLPAGADSGCFTALLGKSSDSKMLTLFWIIEVSWKEPKKPMLSKVLDRSLVGEVVLPSVDRWVIFLWEGDLFIKEGKRTGTIMYNHTLLSRNPQYSDVTEQSLEH